MATEIHVRTARCLAWLPLILISCAAGPTFAQATGEVAEIREQIEALRAEQDRILQLQRQTDASIRALEARLGMIASQPAVADTQPATLQRAASQTPTPQTGMLQTATPQPTPPAAGSAAAAPPAASPLKFSGDMRVRVQSDLMEGEDNERKSTQVRARFGATYAATDRITIGARIVTGDPDDPNSTDVQLSNWDDDLLVSLDLAYLQANLGDVKLYGGKIPQPFTRTDLVWDSDVNPQGVSAVYTHELGGGSAFHANGLLFAIDERTLGDDSSMAGLQLGYNSATGRALKYDAAVGYYDYNVSNILGADAGDFRTNQRNSDGSYVSDFALVDVVGSVSWQGENAKWPLRMVADYVRNLGAESNTDTGYGLDISLGRASQAGDWRVTYGYSQTDVDAVLAAFSHDNIAIGTNYQLHALTVEYTPVARTTITGIWYRYSPEDAAFAGTLSADDWLDRFRVYVVTSF